MATNSPSWPAFTQGWLESIEGERYLESLRTKTSEAEPEVPSKAASTAIYGPDPESKLMDDLVAAHGDRAKVLEFMESEVGKAYFAALTRRT